MTRNQPPRWAARLLNRLIPDGELQAPVGDYEEVWHHLQITEGTFRADFWYVRSLLGILPGRIFNSFYFSLLMLHNYLKTSYRNMLRNKTYSAVNLLSLTLGTACFLLISVYVNEESNFDRFHENADHIYRVNVDFQNPTSVFSNALSSAPMGPAIQENGAGVAEFVRVSLLQPEALMQAGSVRAFESGGYYADSSFFNVFSFPLIFGDPRSALASPNSVVLTLSMAQKYFGRSNPIGESMRMNNQSDWTVTGVIEDVPGNSHFQFDFLLSFSSLNPRRLTSWFSNPYYTFVKLDEGVDSSSLVPVLEQLVLDNMAEGAANAGVSVKLWLQPLTDIRLNPQQNDLSEGRGLNHLFILSGIALFILFLACINFVNLTTARSSTRAKEVGMRKVIGATRSQLISQVLGESGLLSFIACSTGLLLAWGVLPWFEMLVDRPVKFALGWQMGLFILATVATVSLLSGIVPALQLSRFQPAHILKGEAGSSGKSGLLFRNGLVVFQFTVSVALIAVTIMVYRQVSFMKNFDLGLTTDQVAVIPVNASQIASVETLKQQFKALNGVDGVTYSNRAPGTGAFGNLVRRLDTGDNSSIENKYLYADNAYLEVLNIPLIAGRYFDESTSNRTAPTPGEPQSTEVRTQFVLNEKSVRDLGWSSPSEAIGQPLELGGDIIGDVIGVMANYRFQPLTVNMQPTIFQYASSGQGVIMVKLNTNNFTSTMNALEETWNTLEPEWPFSATFLDDQFDALYTSQEQFGSIFSTFAVLAIIIACLGLFGLATFSVQRRRREIGIRKALGASDGNIMLLLSRNFGVLVVIANVVAWPLAWYFVKDWQQEFISQASVAYWVFPLAGLITLLIAGLTISIQASQASRTNPVEVLRTD